MVIEFEDHSEEGRRLLLRYLDQLRAQSDAPASPEVPQPGCLWRLLGRLYLAYWRWRYRRRN